MGDKIKSIKNNKGYTLVELIAAIGAAAVVAGSIAALISFSMRMFDRESKNTSTQYEIQTNLNQVVDSIEQAQWFAIKDDTDGYVRYAAFGKIQKNASDGKYYYIGEIFVTGTRDADNRFNIYMNRYKDGVLEITDIDAPIDSIEGVESTIKNDIYLLGEGAKTFTITAASVAPTSSSSSSSTVTVYEFKNPITFNVSMDFEKMSMGKLISKHVEDKVTVRNFINAKVYNKDNYYSLKTVN